MKENPIENEWWLTILDLKMKMKVKHCQSLFILDLKMKMKENPSENE